MIKNLSLDEFLSRNSIDKETWEKANIEWQTLQTIAADHEAKTAKLGDEAAYLANAIQKFDKVHSVRWRVKNSEHLLEKIVRKRAEGEAKYADITLKNYFNLVTDLVGIRALHLFKEDCLEIDPSLKSLGSLQETPIVYIRKGDDDALCKKLEEKGFEIKLHPKGYRSVHYVIEAGLLNHQIISEVQVRTIFEEGWSEIDHKVRYPNFSENELVGYYLDMFNRMAGRNGRVCPEDRSNHQTFGRATCCGEKRKGSNFTRNGASTKSAGKCAATGQGIKGKHCKAEVRSCKAQGNKHKN